MDNSNNFGNLTSGLTAFLHEVDGYRTICIRHAPFAEVADEEGALHVRLRYACSGDVVPLIERRCGSLPRDRHAPAGNTWRGQAVLVSISYEDGALAVTILSPPPVDGLPVLPLRRVAGLLLCHEHLVAGLRVEPMRGQRRHARDPWPLQAYLQWAMRDRSEWLRSALEDWSDC